MDTSSLIDSNPKIKIQTGDRLFFDHYQYCLKFYMPEMSAMRYFHKPSIDLTQLLVSIDHCLSVRKELEHKLSYYRFSMTHERPNYWFGAEHAVDLKQLAVILYNKRNDLKLTISGSWAYVYSNDFDFLKHVSTVGYVRYCSFREMKVNRPRETVRLRNSPHSLRSYFSDIWLTAEEKESMVAFLTAQTDIRMSPGLRSWCKNNILWIQRNHFIDYNTASFPLALQLINPRTIRKTMQIIEVNT